ncbi:MAG: MFS transporter [bacterium]
MKKLFNKVIKILLITDFTLTSGLGFVAPVFAIFIINRIAGGTIEIVGYAAAVYWIVKSAVTIPFGNFLDRNHGEKDDLLFIFMGSLLTAIATFGFIIARTVWHIYLLQSLYAIGIGMNIPAYSAIFTRHIDKGREASDWSFHSAFIGLGTGVTGAFGGVIAYKFGFNILFIIVGIVIAISAFIPLIFLKNEVLLENKKVPRAPQAKSVNPSVPK